MEPDATEAHAREVFAAVEASGFDAVLTSPNADAGNRRLAQLVERVAAADEGRFRLVRSFGADGYFAVLARAAAMVGNSSSGILEAASFELPVVNVGTRQNGRLRPANVIDVAPEREAVAEAIRRATSPDFRRGLAGLENPYGDGRASERIVRVLTTVPLDDRLLRKRFVDA